MERERLKKEQEISRAKEEREKAKRKNLMRIGSVTVSYTHLVTLENSQKNEVKLLKRLYLVW